MVVQIGSTRRFRLGMGEQLVGIDGRTITGPQVVEEVGVFDGIRSIRGCIDTSGGCVVDTIMEIEGTVESNARPTPES